MMKQFERFVKLVVAAITGAVKDTSNKKKLDEVDFAKLTRNALIFGGGSALAYMIQYMSGVDYGIYTPFIGAGLAGVLDVLRRYLKQN